MQDDPCTLLVGMKDDPYITPRDTITCHRHHHRQSFWEMVATGAWVVATCKPGHKLELVKVGWCRLVSVGVG